MNDRPKQFLPGVAGADVPMADTTAPQGAETGNGPLAGLTPNYSLNLTNFDWITWHNYEWDNWMTVDALLQVAIGFLNIVGVWRPQTAYIAGQTVFDPDDLNELWLCELSHTSGTQWDQAEQDAYWSKRTDASPPVTSVHGRIGDVVGVVDDYQADLITVVNSTLVYSDGTHVQAVLEDFDTELFDQDGRLDVLEGKQGDYLDKTLATLQSVVGPVDWSGMQKYGAQGVYNDPTLGDGNIIPLVLYTDGINTQSWQRFADRNVQGDYIDFRFLYTDGRLDVVGHKGVVDGVTYEFLQDYADAVQPPTRDNAIMRKQWTDYGDSLRVRWRAPYVLGTTYEANDMVLDAPWTMVANKQTMERAAPQPDGNPQWDLPDVPAWANNQHLGVVRSGREWDVLVPVSLNAYSVWAPTLNDDTNYTIWLYSYPTGQPELITYQQIAEPLLNEGTWTEIRRDPTLITAGTTIGILVDALNSGSSIAPGGTPADWTRQSNSNNGDPSTGGWNRSNNGSTLRIHENTADAALIDMVGVVAGSKITFTSTDNPNSSITYLCTTDESYAANVYSWTVQISDTGPAGEPPVGVRCVVSFDVPVAASTDYVQQVGGNPGANTRGLLELDGVPVAGVEDDAFGVRIEFEPYIVSADWDIVAYSGSSGGGGGGGTDPGGGASVSTGPTFPDTPTPGDLHYMTEQPVGLYVWYDDGTSQQWVMTNGGSTGGDYISKSVTDSQSMQGQLIINSSIGVVAGGKTGLLYNESVPSQYWQIGLTPTQGTDGSSDYFFLRSNGIGYSLNGWQTTSDASQKKNLRSIGGSALDLVRQLTGHTYERIDSDITQSGLIAQDVQAILPHAVDVFQATPDSKKLLTYDPQAVIALLVEAIKELTKEVRGG